MTAVDRLSPGYEPNFDVDYALGRQGEMYFGRVVDALASGDGRIEIKTDERAIQTGSVYIEYACYRLGAWQPSGIAITESEWWGWVLAGDVVVAAPTWRVKRAIDRLGRTPFFMRETTRGSHPTRGVVIPLDRLFKELFWA